MKQLPTSFPGFNDSIYAGFGLRLGSLILDALIPLPFIILIEFINSFARVNYFYTILFSFSFFIFYQVYCVKQWGGSPGKLLMNIKILKLDGRPVGWEHAFLRQIISICYSIISIIMMCIALSRINDALFDKLNFLQRSVVLTLLSPIPFNLMLWINYIWIISELIVLLLNERKRALHDYIANTVVVKGKYFNRLQDWLDRQDGSQIVCPGCGRSRIVKRYGNFECSACSTRFNFSKSGIIEID